MLPQFRLTQEVLEAVWQLAKGPGRLSGSLIGTKSSPHHYLSVKVEDCRWQVKASSRSVGDYMVTLLPYGVEPYELQIAWERLVQEISSKTDDVPVEPLHICKSFCGFVALQSPARLVLRFTVLHPSIPLQFTPVPQVKIVNTSLSVQLVKETKRTVKFLTGYLTQDQNKRIVVLLPSDPNCGKYPMAGIWATGLPKPTSPVSDKQRNFPFLHPLIWAAAVRYLQTSALRSRISPSPETHTFLFIYFDPMPRFYEVSVPQGAEMAGWKTTTVEKVVAIDSPAIISFSNDEEKSDGSVTSSQELGDSGLTTRAPSTASSTEDFKESLMRAPSVPVLRTLHSTVEKCDSHREGVRKESRRVTVNTSYPKFDDPHTPTKTTTLTLTPTNTRSHYEVNPLRFSIDESILAGHKASQFYHMDMESARLPPVSEVPRITYQALSDSSEDEFEQERCVRTKYLKSLERR